MCLVTTSPSLAEPMRVSLSGFCGWPWVRGSVRRRWMKMETIVLCRLREHGAWQAWANCMKSQTKWESRGMTYQRQTIWKERKEEQTPVRGRDGGPYSPQREGSQYHSCSHLLFLVFPFLDTTWLGCSFSLRDNAPSLHLLLFFLDVLSGGLFLQPHDP